MSLIHPFMSSWRASGQDLGLGLGEGRVRDLGRTTKDGSSQRSAVLPVHNDPLASDLTKREFGIVVS